MGNDNVNVGLYSTLSHIVPVCSLHWILLKQTSLQQANKAGGVEVWNAHVQTVEPTMAKARWQYSMSKLNSQRFSTW